MWWEWQPETAGQRIQFCFFLLWEIFKALNQRSDLSDCDSVYRIELDWSVVEKGHWWELALKWSLIIDRLSFHHCEHTKPHSYSATACCKSRCDQQSEVINKKSHCKFNHFCHLSIPIHSRIDHMKVSLLACQRKPSDHSRMTQRQTNHQPNENRRTECHCWSFGTERHKSSVY
jgi:hypothetical protein